MKNDDLDKALAQSLARTLENSLDEIDAGTLSELNDARKMAVAARSEITSPKVSVLITARKAVAISLTMAASIVVMVMFFPKHNLMNDAGYDMAVVDDNQSYMFEDPEMLSDMNMLMAMDELDTDT